MQAPAKTTAANINSTIELILTPRPRAGYAGIKSRVGFRMITSFPGNGFLAPRDSAPGRPCNGSDRPALQGTPTKPAPAALLESPFRATSRKITDKT